MFPGERITVLRESREMTKAELADSIHVSRSSVTEYENGTRQPSMSVLLGLADFFNVSLDYLMGRTFVKTTFQQLEEKLTFHSGVIPIDMIFRLNNVDKEAIAAVLYSYMVKEEYRKK